MEGLQIKCDWGYDWRPVEALLKKCEPHTTLFQRATNLGRDPVFVRVNWQTQSKGNTEWRTRQIEINPGCSRSVEEVASVLLFELEILTRSQALDEAHAKGCDVFEYVFRLEAIEYKALARHFNRLDRFVRKGIVLNHQTREDYHLGDFIAYLRKQERLGHFQLLNRNWRGSFFPDNDKQLDAKGAIEYWKKRFSWFDESILPR